MMNLLKAEIIKIITNKIFWIIIAVYLVSFWTTIGFIEFTISDLEKGLPFELANFEFPKIWGYFTFVSKYLNIIPILAIFFFITNDYSYKTMRQKVMDGSSKRDIIISNQILIIIYGLFTTAVTASFIIYTGSKNPTSISMFDNISYLGRYFILTIGMFNMAMLFSHIFRGLLVSIIVFLGYFLLVETLFGQFLLYNGFSYSIFGVELLSLFPRNSIFNLVEFSNIAGQSVETSIIAPALIWCIIFPIISYLTIKHKDI
ncbi:hypothetical protein OAQ99_02915 [Candidatus Kapabacteria bacterium]|nr:hypothetical protein [Candidatus Kapabacteria bacterium]